MRRLFLVLMLALTLPACTTFRNIETAVQLGTASVANPVTPTRLNELESGITIVFAGLNAWKASCKQGLINANCKDQIRAVQVYTRQIPPYLTQLRAFVRNNDQVNAMVVFNNLTDLITTVKRQAANAGQNIGS